MTEGGFGRAVPSPDVYVNVTRVKELHEKVQKAYPEREYIFKMLPSEKLLNLEWGEIWINYYADDDPSHEGVIIRRQKVKIPAFVKDNKPLLTLEDFFEFELAWAGQQKKV